MTYTEDQLTGWIKGVPPGRDGVYKTSTGHFAYWSKSNGWGVGRETVEGAIEGKDMGIDKYFYHLEFEWRGLSQNPNAKPKRSGNKRKVMYVVAHKATRCAEAVFSKKKNAQEYAKHITFSVYITKIRFRTPEQN